MYSIPYTSEPVLMAASPLRLALSPTAAAVAAAANTNNNGNTNSPNHTNTNGNGNSNGNGSGNNGGGNSGFSGAANTTMSNPTTTVSPTAPGGPLVHTNGTPHHGVGHHPVTITVVNHGGHPRAAGYGQASSHQPVPATPLVVSRQNSFDRSILTSGLRLAPPSDKRTNKDGSTDSSNGAAGTVRSVKRSGSMRRCGIRCLMRQIWWIVLIIGVAAAAMTYVFSYREARDTWVADFVNECEERRVHIASVLLNELLGFKAVVTLFGSIGYSNVTRNVFESFASQLVTDDPDSCIKAVSWYEKVTFSNRASYQTTMAASYNMSTFNLTTHDNNDAYPLTYTTITDSRSYPPHVSHASLGEDAQVQYGVADWDFLQSITNGAATSSRLESYEVDGETSLLLTFFFPVYDTVRVPSTVNERLSHAVGFIAAVIDLHMLLDELFDSLPQLSGNVEVSSVTNTRDLTDGCAIPSETVTTDKQTSYRRLTTASTDSSVASFATTCLANRLWQITCTPSITVIREEAGIAPAIYLVAVGITTVLLAILLHRLVRISLLSRRIDAANQKKSQYVHIIHSNMLSLIQAYYCMFM
jgi:hypothetical protein